MSDVFNDIAVILARAGVRVWGTAPADALEDEPPGHRPSDLLQGARSLVGFGIPVPRAVFDQPCHPVESNWRVQNLYYRKLDELSVQVAIMLEERGQRAMPTLGCLPLETHGLFVISGYVNQIAIGVATRIGARGRNGLLVHPRYGSRLMLGGVITTGVLESRVEPEPGDAGCPAACSRCVEVCPIGAIEPHRRRVRSAACLRHTARTPLLPRWRYLWLHLTGQHHSATRLLNVTSPDEHTFHICSRCVAACPEDDADKLQGNAKQAATKL